MQVRPGILVSCTAHAALLVYAIVGLSSAKPFEITPTEALPIEILTPEEFAAMKGSKTSTKVDAPKQKAEQVADADSDPVEDDRPVAKEDVKAPPPPPPPAAEKAEAAPKPDPAVKAEQEKAKAEAAKAEAARAEAVKAQKAEKAAQEKAAAEKAAKAEAEKVAQAKAAEAKAAQEKAAAEKAEKLAQAAEAELRAKAEAEKRAAAEKAAQEKLAQEKAEAEKAAKLAADKAAAEKAAKEKAEKLAKAEAEKKAEAERVAKAEKAAKDKEAAEKAAKAAERKFDPSKIASLLGDKPSSSQSAMKDVRDPGRKAASARENAPETTAGTSRGTATKLSMSARTGIDNAVREQVMQCWNPPVGAANDGSLAVKVSFTLNADGTLADGPTVTNSSSNPAFRAAAGAATRAVQRCAPLKLPPEAYDYWRQVNINFDPKELMGG